MRFPSRPLPVIAIVAVGVMVPLTAEAVTPLTSSSLTISARPKTVTYNGLTAITGTLEGTPRASVLVTLEDNPAPFTRGFEKVTVTRTDQNGSFRFAAVPLLNTRYRTTTVVPAATSSAILVKVKMKVFLEVGERTPSPRERVEFSGTVVPEHDGQPVEIQRRKHGRWRTVAHAKLKDTGADLSSFSRRIRVRRSGTYRARVRRDFDHATCTSRPKRIIVL